MQLLWGLLLTTSALAVQPNELHIIRASADATIEASPDRVQINVGVTTSALTAGVAGEQNATIADRVTNALRQTIAQRGTLKSVGYSVEPQFQYANGASKLTGYQASNTLQIDLDDLSLTGKVIDSALQAGATNIGGVVFTLRDETKARDEALAQAAERAHENASAIAKALGSRVIGVVSAETGETGFTPRPMMVRSMAKAVPETPVNPGTIEIHANVTVTIAIE